MNTSPRAAMALGLALGASLTMMGCAERETRLEQHLVGIIRQQEAAWNRGDVDAFMEAYWNSEQTTFSTGGRTLHGWQATLARYRQRYPTAERMGRLEFSGLLVRPLGETAALVLGDWHLTREPDSVSGNFSLVFQRIDGRWLITHDHTSVTAPAESQPTD